MLTNICIYLYTIYICKYMTQIVFHLIKCNILVLRRTLLSYYWYVQILAIDHTIKAAAIIMHIQWIYIILIEKSITENWSVVHISLRNGNIYKAYFFSLLSHELGLIKVLTLISIQLLQISSAKTQQIKNLLATIATDYYNRKVYNLIKRIKKN